MSILDGKTIRGYQLNETVGAGGFGTVYKAYQQAIQREVAIKVINERYINESDFIRRFEAEARIIARLEHPHIIPLYDYWRDPQGAYLVMRWLQGGTLRSLMNTKRPTLVEISRILSQLASALGIAHERNIIHRDIKPENILFDTRGNTYLTDFGIAIDFIHERETTMGNILYGSPQYISPEQLSEKRATVQSDVYSLGIMLYEMLIGHVPFEHSDSNQVLQMQLHQPIPSLILSRPELPEAFDLIIWQATAKKPESRFKNVHDFAQALQSIVEQLPESLLKNLPFDHDTAKTSRGYATRQFHEKEPKSQPVTKKFDTDTSNINYRTAQLPDDYSPEAVIDNVLQNPYKGLRPFEEADAHDFFGREALVDKLLTQIKNPDTRLLALIGPSGSGKSSVVRAGILPKLRRDKNGQISNWFITRMVPGADPFRELSQALLRVAVNAPEGFATLLRERVDNLHEYLPDMLPDPDAVVLIFIDQFEELFTACDSLPDRTHFLEMLYHALQAQDSRLRLILTLRADFYDRPLHYVRFGDLLQQNTHVILPLGLAQLEAAIVQPAKMSGVVVDDQLRDAIVNDVLNQPGALPLMQYAMTELFERRSNNHLSLDGYKDIGGITGALARRADELYNSLDQTKQRFARQMFLRLITIGESEKPTRRRVRWDMLLSDQEDREHYSDVIDLFVQNRLLTLDRDPITRTPTIEIAHEAMILGWEKIRTWVNDNQADLNRREQLRLATKEWLTASQESSYLASGGRLAEFESLLGNEMIILGSDERQYIYASIAMRQKSVRRTRMVIFALTAFSIVTLITAIAALFLQQTAEQARADALVARDTANVAARIAKAGELAASALANLDDLDLAMLLSVEAALLDSTYEALNSLLTTLQVNPYVKAFLHGHDNHVRALSYTSDGAIAVTAGRDGLIYRWDTTDYQAIGAPLSQHQGTINDIAISPGDDILISVGADGQLNAWNLSSGEIMATKNEHNGSIWSVAFSPDGTQFASGGADGQMVIYDATSFEVLHRVDNAHNDIIYALTYNPDGSHLASGGGDMLVKIWDSATAELILPVLEGHTNWVRTLAYHPNGQALASSGADTIIRLWNATNGEFIGGIDTGHRNWVQAVSFSPDGQVIASASMDETIQIWNLQNGQPITPEALHAHTGSIWDMRFHPQEFEILSGGEDNDAIIWQIDLIQRPGNARLNANTTNSLIEVDLSGEWMAITNNVPNNLNETLIQIVSIPDNEVAYQFTRHETTVTAMAFHPTSRLMTSASAGQVLVWDIETGALLNTLTVGNPNVLISTVAFMPDGNKVLLANEQGLAQLWTWTNDEVTIEEFAVQPTGVTAMTVSNNGRYAAFGSRDTSIEVWDLQDLTQLHNLSGIHTDAIETMVFVDDEILISGGRDAQIILWDMLTGESLQQPIVTNDWVLSLAVNIDRGLFASSSRDTTIQLWDLASGRQIGLPFIGHRNWVTVLQFDTIGTLESISRDGLVIAWDTSLESWLQSACAISNRSLQRDEWQRFLRDTSYQPACATS